MYSCPSAYFKGIRRNIGITRLIPNIENRYVTSQHHDPNSIHEGKQPPKTTYKSALNRKLSGPHYRYGCFVEGVIS